MAPQNHEGHHTIPLGVFCAFAPADEPLVQSLEQHLAPLQHQGRLIFRHRGQIAAGDNYTEVIQGSLASVSIILLLVSPAYLADAEGEQEALQTMQGQARVIPVLLRQSQIWMEKEALVT